MESTYYNFSDMETSSSEHQSLSEKAESSAKSTIDTQHTSLSDLPAGDLSWTNALSSSKCGVEEDLPLLNHSSSLHDSVVELSATTGLMRYIL